MAEVFAERPDGTLQCILLAAEGLIDLQCCNVEVAAIEAVLQLDLPVVSNQSAHGPQVSAYWLAPAHWLLRVPDENGQKLADRLRHAIHVAGAASGGAAEEALHAAVTVVSEAFVGIRLQGSGAASLLSHGCALDLELLIPGRCARTLLARTQVLLVPLRHVAGYDLFVERNYAEYLREWVSLAARI